MSKEGWSKGGGATYVDESVPYSTIARRERSRKLAQRRRDTYKTIMDDLTGVLPFPNDAISQLDYNSRLRLALCFFRLKTMVDREGDKVSSVSSKTGRASGSSGKQIVKRKAVHSGKPVLLQPGMLQELMTEALDGFLMVIQVDGTVVFLSEGVHRHLGLFQSEYIGMTVYDLILDEDHDGIRKKISEAEAKSLTRTTRLGATNISFFCRMKCSRGKVVNTITRSPGYKLVYVSGTLKVSKEEPFIACVVHPVSPPSILELRMEGNMFVTHYSMDMTCLFFDGRLRQLLGYAKEDLVGSTPFTLHHHEDTEATLQCSRGVMARGEGLSGYYRFLNHFGEYVWLQTRATLMYDSRTGQPSYIVCMNFIISKEDGDKDLELRQAIADGGSNIKSDADHAHDPFPLNEREDGKAVNPLQGKESASTDDSPRQSREEPSSTVELSVAPKEEVSSVTTDCVSPDSGDLKSSESSSIPSIMVGSKSSRLHLDGSPVVISSHEDSTGSTVSSSSNSPMSHTIPCEPHTSLQVTNSNSKVGNCCQPDSTTFSQPDTQKKNDTNLNRSPMSDDVGYHSETSHGTRQMVSVGNESEVSGSSCAHRSSPEPSMFTAVSPDYPQSVFSSDNLLPPPGNQGSAHTNSAAFDFQYTLHYPSSEISHSTIPAPPETRVYQVSSVNQHGFKGSLPQQFIHGQPSQLCNQFYVSRVSMDSQPRPQYHGRSHLNFGDGHYGDGCYGDSCCPSTISHQSVGGTGGFIGTAPTNFHPNKNNGSSSTSFMKEEPSSPPRYASPYSSNSTTEGATVIFSTPEIFGEQILNQSRQPPQMAPCHHQPQHHSTVFSSRSVVFTRSAVTSIQGNPPSYQLTHFSGSQAATPFTSDLPQLTGEDLKMLDAFGDQVRGEEGQFVQLHSQQTTLNGAGMMLQ